MDLDDTLGYYGIQDEDTLECQVRAGGGDRCFNCRTFGLA